MDDLLSEFLTESTESLAVLDVELVKLEENPNNPEMLANIFRLVHTIKGTCGFLALERLEALAHSAENVLGQLREGDLEVTPEAITLVLGAIDRIKEILAAIEATEAEPEGNDADLISGLDALAEGGPEEAVTSDQSAAGADSPDAASADALETGPQPAEGLDDLAADAGASSASLYDRLGGPVTLDAAVELFYDKVLADDYLKGFFANTDMNAQRALLKDFVTTAFGAADGNEGQYLTTVYATLVGQGLDDSHFETVVRHLKATLEELGTEAGLVGEAMAVVEGTRDAVLGQTADAGKFDPVVTAQIALAKAAAEEPAPATAANTESAIANQSIRVNVHLLEGLMNLVSELVLTRNQLLQMVRGHSDSEFTVPLQRLSHVTTDLQEGVMKTRMQPIGNAWAKLPRLVRDLSLDLGKKIKLEMRGADTELDRQVLELIKDPLTHMVRNSADHGLETPEERRAAGKPETGRVLLNAYHEGGHIIIEVGDDGRGINIDKVKAKIIGQNMATSAELEAMPDQQVLQYIFKPGFSTAEKVTNVSGRGVGMDVVRSNIERIGGTVELKSTAARGSSFTIKIPLTLAIVSALIVEAAGERFAIPQIAVNSLVRVSANSENKIETINETPLLRLRNRLLPLISLSNVLKLNQSCDEDQSDEMMTEGFVVVTQVGNYAFGIIVDKVFDTEEIVVKPVAPILRHINMFSGNTILGDGSVIMILDPNGMAAATGEATVADSASVEDTAAQASRRSARTSLLLFRAGGAEPKAVPLELVARLEEIGVDKIETTNGRPVVQYRGQLMPLVSPNAGHGFKEEGRQPILVFTDNDRSMGLIVDEIVDIVEDELKIEQTNDDPGTLGSAVIAGKATEILDAGYYLVQAFGNWFERDEWTIDGESKHSRRILVIDDSPFFCNLMKPLLLAAGYEVTAITDPNAALALREDGEDFDVILSDVEMPGMSGFEFVETIRQEGPWQGTPVVALSSHTRPEDFERGRQAGFNDYVAKSDRDALLHIISQTLSSNESRGAA